MGFIHFMKKAHFFLLLLVLLIACNTNPKKEIFQATGKINNISVIIDDQLWNGEIGDSIRNKFASPVTGLPQEEPLFTIYQYPVKLLEGFMTNNRNIIVVKKGTKTQFKVLTNEFAKPQNVFHISGKTSVDILNLLQQHAGEILQTMHDTELLEAQTRIDSAVIDDKIVQQLFNVTVQIPTGYKVALKSDKFIWFKKEIISGNTSLLIYDIPIRCLSTSPDAITDIIRMRDSIGDLYIHGTVPGSKMITEGAYSPYLAQIMLDGKKTFETKGTWELQNDYMSGPFINYAIVDKERNRIIVLEGFCYAPSKEKRDLVQELEAIIKSVKIL